MAMEKRTASISSTFLRWIARLGSLVSIGLVIILYFGQGFSASLINWQNWLELALFPGGLVVGLVIAWWAELAGGIVSIASLAIFYLLTYLVFQRPVPGGWSLVVFASPALLFLAMGLRSHKNIQ